jgi:hypothetical protein
VTGGGQTGKAGSTLPIALAVKAINPYTGTPIVGATIAFSDGPGHGTFGNRTPVTDNRGVASTTYTLPRQAQIETVTATASDLANLSMTETGVPGPATAVVVGSGNNQTGPVSQALPNALAAKVRDQYTNGVAGVLVTFSDGGLGGSFSPTQVVSDSLGYARTIYTTPPTTGTVKVTASATNLKIPATFTVTVQ